MTGIMLPYTYISFKIQMLPYSNIDFKMCKWFC